jgi:predicted adenylyl cyclase CyaB
MRNVEAKFALSDIAVTQRRAEAARFQLIATLTQHDTFFVVSKGKLKLREQPDGAWLIHYLRRRAGGFELSDYEIVPVPRPLDLRKLLITALGSLAEVRKRRTLLRRGKIRLHLDQVDDLGDFGEIEAVLEADQDPAESRVEVAEILVALQIPSGQLIESSYFQLKR